MDKLQACKETKELWTEMARIAREEKRFIEKFSVKGPWKYYAHNCPCCEYIKFAYCDQCPMNKEWTFYSNLDDTPCQGKFSPYQKWRVCRLSSPFVSLCIDIEFFCLLIAEMAEEAIERYMAGSHSKFLLNKDGSRLQFNNHDFGVLTIQSREPSK